MCRRTPASPDDGEREGEVWRSGGGSEVEGVEVVEEVVVIIVVVVMMVNLVVEVMRRKE